MTTPEMHVMFRQFAQQMGMQNVRAILPEQIDLVLNTSQMDIVNQTIKENVGINNDRVITDNSKLGQVNALRTLYTVKLFNMTPIDSDMPVVGGGTSLIWPVFTFSAVDRYTGKMSNHGDITNIPKYLFLVDFALNYKKCITGYSGEPIGKQNIPTFADDAFETNFYPVRLIDDVYLADTLNDFVLKPNLRSPIIVTYNNGTFDLYIDKFTKEFGGNTYKLKHGLIPYQLRMSYIAPPHKIEFNEDMGEDSPSSDLPEYMHVDIVKHAVDLYRMAISGSIMAAQNQERVAEQENVRNNYRNDGRNQ